MARLLKRPAQIDAPASGMDLNTQYEMIAEQSRSRLMHALDVMADGFALYDANDRIVLYNRKYVDYSPLVADIIMPGVAKEEILRKSTHAWRLRSQRHVAGRIYQVAPGKASQSP